MPEPHEQLEQELQTIWQHAANTRKASSQRRVEHILRRSRAELSARDLLKFTSHLLSAFFQLYGAVLNSLFATSCKPDSAPEKYNHE
ncbi:MAG: hypothetical protein R3E93_09420 [Thiothrix sp.]